MQPLLVSVPEKRVQGADRDVCVRVQGECSISGVGRAGRKLQQMARSAAANKIAGQDEDEFNVRHSPPAHPVCCCHTCQAVCRWHTCSSPTAMCATHAIALPCMPVSPPVQPCSY